jgi:hypothetical protein
MHIRSSWPNPGRASSFFHFPLIINAMQQITNNCDKPNFTLRNP